jgi:hypothetical protein
MMKLNSQAIYFIFTVSLLTALNGCALLPFESDPNSEDPVARAVFQERERVENSRSNTSSLEQAWNDSKNVREDEIQEALYSGEITLGMKMNDVVSLWGRPREVEIAGEPGLGNQKWIYMDRFSRYITSKPLKVIYFEDGRVAGWESEL